MIKQKYSNFKRIILFFSGGLDTSFLLKFFTKENRSEIITVSFDLGGDTLETSTIKQRAKLLGAIKHIFLDVKKTFVEEYCIRAIKANAIFENAHPLSSSLSRPLMAKIGVELAKEYNCSAIMHGSNGWQNNSARFDTAIRVLSDEVEIIEPIMENNISREFEYEYLKRNGIHIEKKEDNLLSSDNNLWGREVEDGVLEFPEHEPSEKIYRLTTSPEMAPNKPEYVEIEFQRGIPTRLNSKQLSSLEIVQRLNEIGGRNGIGRHDAFEDKIIGYKMREIHESPAATILIKVHKDLETIVLPRKTLTTKNFIDQQWTELVCYGLWYHPLREQLEAFIDKVNEEITGTVKVKLYKGLIQIVGRKSPYGLYKSNLDRKLGEVFLRSPHPDRCFYDYYSFESVISNKAISKPMKNNKTARAIKKAL